MEFQFPRQEGICEKFLDSKTFRLYLRNFHRITSSFFCSGLETQNHALINFIKFKNLFLSGSAINGYKFARFQCAYMQSFKSARNLSSQELLSTVTREQLWSDSSCRSSSSGPWLRSAQMQPLQKYGNHYQLHTQLLGLIIASSTKLLGLIRNRRRSRRLFFKAPQQESKVSLPKTFEVHHYGQRLQSHIIVIASNFEM